MDRSSRQKINQETLALNDTLIINITKRQPTEWEKILRYAMTNKGLISKIYNINIKKNQTTWLKNGQKGSSLVVQWVRIHCCHCSGSHHCYGECSIPSLGTSTCCGHVQKKGGGAEDPSGHFPKKNIQTANGYMKTPNITNHQTNAHQNYNEILPHTCQNGYNQKDHK